MDAHRFLRSRRSIRRFTNEAVSWSTMERILATATYAPSAHNRQPWRFMVLTEASAKSGLADAMALRFRTDLERDGLPQNEVDQRVERSRLRISTAPVLVVLCMDASEMDLYPDPPRAEAERVMAIQSTANAGMILLLAAHAEGLGGVWNCSPLFAPSVVKTALDLPQNWEPQALFLIGRPAEWPEPPARKPMREIVRSS